MRNNARKSFALPKRKIFSSWRRSGHVSLRAINWWRNALTMAIWEKLKKSTWNLDLHSHTRSDFSWRTAVAVFLIWVSFPCWYQGTVGSQVYNHMPRLWHLYSHVARWLASCYIISWHPLGVYPIQISLWVFRAEPTKVIAFGKLNEDGIDMEYTGELHFPNGGIAKFKVSCLTALSNTAIIKGSKGEIVVSSAFH